MGERYNFFQIEAEFKKYLSAENVSDATLKNYCSDLRYFFSWLKFTYGVEELSLSDIPNYINTSSLSRFATYINEDLQADKSAKRRFSTMRKFCSFCIAQKWISTNPAKLFDDSKEESEKKGLIAAYLHSQKIVNTSFDLDYCNNVLSEFLTDK